MRKKRKKFKVECKKRLKEIEMAQYIASAAQSEASKLKGKKGHAEAEWTARRRQQELGALRRSYTRYAKGLEPEPEPEPESEQEEGEIMPEDEDEPNSPLLTVHVPTFRPDMAPTSSFSPVTAPAITPAAQPPSPAGFAEGHPESPLGKSQASAARTSQLMYGQATAAASPMPSTAEAAAPSVQEVATAFMASLGEELGPLLAPGPGSPSLMAGSSTSPMVGSSPGPQAGGPSTPTGRDFSPADGLASNYSREAASDVVSEQSDAVRSETARVEAETERAVSPMASMLLDQALPTPLGPGQGKSALQREAREVSPRPGGQAAFASAAGTQRSYTAGMRSTRGGKAPAKQSVHRKLVNNHAQQSTPASASTAALSKARPSQPQQMAATLEVVVPATPSKAMELAKEEEAVYLLVKQRSEDMQTALKVSTKLLLESKRSQHKAGKQVEEMRKRLESLKKQLVEAMNELIEMKEEEQQQQQHQQQGGKM
ncbi:unnamed protein product [Chrysoparadoxa australica]